MAVLIGRPYGFIWQDPHFFSISVTYFDISDFYWSGHVGMCFLVISEWQALGWKKMVWLSSFIALNEATLMTLTRGHYAIDIIMGILIARLIFRTGEWLAYFYDVKLMGLPRKKRETYWYKPCSLCGWSNSKAASLTQEAEIEFQKDFRAMRDHCQ